MSEHTGIEWTEAQRQEAMIWALVQQGVTMDAAAPPHLARYVRAEGSPSEASGEVHA